MNASREVEATPQILGMVRKVEHMVKVLRCYFENLA
jgi:large subunit ribosomal protein L30